MTTTDLVLYTSVAFVGIVLSALFSGTETGLYTLNRVRLAVRAARGEAAAMRLRRIRSNPNRMLATLLIGNNIANYAGSFGIAAILDGAGYSPIKAIVINAAILIPLLFVFGETLPKDLFRTHTDHWSYALSGFVLTVDRILTWTGLSPLVQMCGRVFGRFFGGDSLAASTARQRISQLIKEGIGAGVLTEAQSSLADRALAMRDRTVATEMVPWRQVTTIAVDVSRAVRERTVRQHNFTRLPVVDGDGRPIGVVSTIDALLAPDQPIASLMHEPPLFTPNTPLREALRVMRTQRSALAVVTDPRSGLPLGIVTLKDLIEPLTGELSAW